MRNLKKNCDQNQRTVQDTSVIAANLAHNANFLNCLTNPIYLATLVIILQDGEPLQTDRSPATAGCSDEG